MKNKECCFKTGKARLVLNTMFLAALAGCLSSAQGEGLQISVPLPVIVVGAPVVVTQDTYVYYPTYGVYYNTYRHQYAYQDGGEWVSRSAPMGVSASVLLASPSVKMDFHDSPSHHHADMAKKYPKSYRGDHAAEKADVHGRDDHGRDDHGHDDHNGK